jgi:hypothetical protein
LSEILAVETAKKGATDSQHCFEIRTANVDYFVGEDANEKPGSDNSGSGAILAKQWEVAIRQALMPVAQGAGQAAAGAAANIPRYYLISRTNQISKGAWPGVGPALARRWPGAGPALAWPR